MNNVGGVFYGIELDSTGFRWQGDTYNILYSYIGGNFSFVHEVFLHIRENSLFVFTSNMKKIIFEPTRLPFPVDEIIEEIRWLRSFENIALYSTANLHAFVVVNKTRVLSNHIEFGRLEDGKATVSIKDALYRMITSSLKLKYLLMTIIEK